jgi:DNA polymerase-3 subunit delta
MKYEDILGELKKKIFHQVYFLYGKEPYHIDKIADYIAGNVLPPEEQAFNQFIFYGKDSDLMQIIGQAKKFPMMSNHQVIIVREAQMLKGLTSAPTKNKSNPLLLYCQNTLPSTILVFCYKIPTESLEKIPASFFTGLGKKTVVFESKPLYDRELPGFVSQYLKSRNYTITPRAVALLTESVGSALATLARELEKLIIALPAGKTEIGEKLVEENIGISREYNIFELQNSMVSGDTARVFKIAHFLAARKDDRVISMIDRLFDFFVAIMKYHALKDRSNEQEVATELGVNRFFLKNYIAGARRFSAGKLVVITGILREYDMKCKGLGAGDEKGELFREMVAKIMYV